MSSQDGSRGAAAADAAAAAAAAAGAPPEQQQQQQQRGAATVLPPTNNLSPARPWYSEPCMLGIDEAGRGPVLGAMVYAVAAVPCSYKDTLATKSYADSKTLSEAERTRLFAALAADASAAYAAELLPAAAISAAMLARVRVSLNAIAEASTLRLIQAVLDAGVNLTEVYVDTVGDANRYASRLSAAFPGLAFTVCPKADALYPVVSAASIAAKVLRDTSLQVEQEQLADAHKGQLGNGYPSDTTTQAWLQANCHPVFGFPDIVRFSWETCSRILEERCVKVTWAADAGGGGGGGGGGGQQQTLSCFKAPADNSGESSGLGRHAYFRLRRMQRVAMF